MATVFLAHDRELDRPVAIKVLAEHLAADDLIRERFVREARFAARLSHPNVVSVFDAGEADELPYIVMEYVEGETLAEHVRRDGRLAPAAVVGLGVQACRGLAHAHAAGLVHRDVKPQNLLLRGDGVLKITDFGIARAVEATRLTQLGTILGTAAYLAPEQAAGEQVTATADVYSLGVVLYELLTGRPPHVFETLEDLVRKHADEPVSPVRDLAPEVPPRLEDLVMRCLARVPAYRPASADELAAELAASSPGTRPAPGPERTRVAATRVLPARASGSVPEAAARRPRLWLAAATGGAVLLLLGIALAAGRDEAEPPRAEPAVSPAPRGATPEEGARSLSAWLRRYSR